MYTLNGRCFKPNNAGLRYRYYGTELCEGTIYYQTNGEEIYNHNQKMNCYKIGDSSNYAWFFDKHLYELINVEEESIYE